MNGLYQNDRKKHPFLFFIMPLFVNIIRNNLTLNAKTRFQVDPFFEIPETIIN